MYLFFICAYQSDFVWFAIQASIHNVNQRSFDGLNFVLFAKRVSTIACTKTFLIPYLVFYTYLWLFSYTYSWLSELLHVRHFIGTQQYVKLGFDYLWVGRCVNVIVSFKNVQLP